MTKANEERIAAATDILTEYMLEKRCRKTPERYALIKAVYSIGEPFSVDSLQAFVAKQMVLSRITVYNNLKMFIKAGLVIKLPTPGLEMYEACYQNQPHHKLVCTVCGATTEFLDDSITDFVMEKRFKKFHLSSCSVTIFGVCARCRAKQNREKKKLRDKKKQ